MPSTILVSGPSDGVTTIVLNRPEKKNALSIALRDEVSDVLDVVAAGTDTKVVVITGAGSAFCAGFDLTEFDDDPERQRLLWASSDRFHHALLRFPLPVIAAVNGPALAGGFDLAVLADLRVASDVARFAHPEQAWSEVVYRPLRELVGGSIARELVLTGRSIDAQEAFTVGLVNKVVPADQLMSSAMTMAAAIAAAPVDALRRTKAKIVEANGIPGSLGTLEL